ncbi:MAG: efflux transporter periplasmic adaptor subunit, partial [Beijerinckiaceae bacterium]
ARTVDLGPLDGAMFAVNKGLSPGDRVVVDGADRLRDGAKVLIAAGGEGSDGRAAQPADAAPRDKNGPSNHHGGGHSRQPGQP